MNKIKYVNKSHFGKKNNRNNITYYRLLYTKSKKYLHIDIEMFYRLGYVYLQNNVVNSINFPGTISCRKPVPFVHIC